MKRFDIITEADARVLTRGDTVMLSRGGHITPLAHDTLKDKRVTVVHEGRTTTDEASLAPRADIRAVAIASDHTGIALRRALVAFLRGRGLTVQDLGTGPAEARAIVATWLTTPMRESRYIRRLAKIRDLEHP